MSLDLCGGAVISYAANQPTHMSRTPFFSVVIPTYNRGGLIAKTLASVFSQTCRDFEVVVVDDGSTDDTGRLLEPYARRGEVRYVRHEQNYERARARNTGMEAAAGEYVTFLDSDDLMYPSNLADAARYVEANPEVKLFHNLYELVDGRGRVLCRYDFPSLDDPVRAITGGNFLSSVGVFIHRDVYSGYRFDTAAALTGSEDWEFWLRVVADHRPGRIDKVNNGVVQHGDRSTNGVELERLKERFAYLTNKVANDPHLRSVYGANLKRLEAGALLYTGTVANLNCRHGEALRLLLRAASLDLRLAASVSFVKAFGIAVLRLDKGF
jgi:glycosyltransferase involved in cell wall biosynthesis